MVAFLDDAVRGATNAVSEVRDAVTQPGLVRTILDQVNGANPETLPEGSVGLVPQTLVRTSYAATIHVISGGRRACIGGVQDFSLSVSRPVKDEFHVHPGARGRPVDTIPLNCTNRSLKMRRVDLFGDIMEEILGTSEIVVLSDQRIPISIRETWRHGPSVATRRAYQYINCWLTDLSRSTRVEDIIVMVDVTFNWKDRQLI